MVKRRRSNSDKIIKSGGRKSSYKPEYAKRVKELIMELVPLNSKGELACGKIAKALGVPARTMQEWRNPYSKHFKPDFAAAINESELRMRANIDLGLINANVVLRAQGYKERIKTFEPVVEGPELPAFSRYTKDDLINYAKSFLGLDLKTTMKKGAIEIAIRERVEEMTTEKMKVVRIVEKTIPSDIAAAKYCNQNLGDPDKRWKDKKVTELDVNEETATLLGLIDGSTKGKLPNREEEENAG